MMKRLLSFLLMLLLCSPAATAESSVYYIDGGNADRVHLRAEPFITSDSLGLYFTGTDVIVIDMTAEWAWVMVGDEDGYIMREYLTQAYTNRSGPWYVVDNPHDTWVNLRMSPSMDGMVAMCPENGTRVQLLGETADGWSYVDCDGVMGYIMSSLLSPWEEEEVARETELLANEGVYIHRYTAPNGQHIYFTAYTEYPGVDFVDVNFDGYEDIVITTGRWAKCDTVRFYRYDAERDQYEVVMQTTVDDGLMNYVLYPEYGLVGTYIANGNAGLLHVWNLYRWDGNDLQLIRSAVSDEWSEDIFEGQTYTNIIHGDTLHVTVNDYTNDDGDSLLWEIIISKEDTEYRDIFTEEQEALWQGLK